MPATLRHVCGGTEMLEEVRPLWEELNQHHARVTPDLAAHFASVSFERRIALLRDRAQLRVDLFRAGDGSAVAYAFGSVDAHGRGELESIYVGPEHRGQGLGRALALRQLAWLREQGAHPIRVTVAVGNERALPFYEALGFRTRATTLWLSDAGSEPTP
jgi:ribosomal protein S18 acetylase RimI-like enzyme